MIRKTVDARDFAFNLHLFYVLLTGKCEILIGIRFRYSREELEAWVPKVEEVAGKVKKVVGCFNNHFHGYAPENCLYLIERLGLLSDEQRRAKQRTAKKQSELQSFF